MRIYQCPNCYGTLKEGQIVWSCDDEHPEVLAQQDEELEHVDSYEDDEEE